MTLRTTSLIGNEATAYVFNPSVIYIGPFFYVTCDERAQRYYTHVRIRTKFNITRGRLAAVGRLNGILASRHVYLSATSSPPSGFDNSR